MPRPIVSPMPGIRPIILTSALGQKRTLALSLHNVSILAMNQYSKKTFVVLYLLGVDRNIAVHIYPKVVHRALYPFGMLFLLKISLAQLMLEGDKIVALAIRLYVRVSYQTSFGNG